MIFDSDVVIWALRGNQKAVATIDRADRLEMSVVSYMEILKGSLNKQDMRVSKSYIDHLKFHILPLSEEIGRRAAVYIEQLGLKSNIGISDALIAATAAELTIPLCTANTRDYKSIPGLELKPFRP